MKYLLPIILCSLSLTAFSQHSSNSVYQSPNDYPLLTELGESTLIANDLNEVQSVARGGGLLPVWAEHFSGANSGFDVVTTVGTWTTSGTFGTIWKHSNYTTSGCFSDNTAAPAFATAGNGFLLFDADSFNCVNPIPNPPTFNQTDLDGFITSPQIDLSNYDDVILEFEYGARWCCTDALMRVEISTDDGSTWPTSLIVPAGQVNADMQAIFSQNISQYAGGQSQVRLRFSFGPESHYYWTIDDIVIYQAATQDLKMLYDFVSHTTEGYEEYPRIPVNQVQGTMRVGATLENYGSAIATNSTAAVAVLDQNTNLAFTASESQAVLLPGDTTELIDNATAIIPAGQYTANFTISSDGEGLGSPTFGNNTSQRAFDITNDLYSIDGIGVHPVAILDAVGTESFTDGDDGLMLFSHNPVVASLTVTGVQVQLSNASVAGSIIIAALHDSTAMFNEDVYNPIVSSNAHVVSATDLLNGFIDIPFTQPIYIGPGQYYSGVELFSNSGANELDILDDVTVPQPWWSSMIYIANGANPGLYSNGNALAVRMMIDILTSDESVSEFELNVWPNPTSGEFVVSSDQKIRSIQIHSVDGKLIHSVAVTGQNRVELDLNDIGSGLYNLQIETDNGIKNEKLVID